MTGVKAIVELLNGKKIRRQMWADYNYWFLKDNKLCNQDGHFFNMAFNELIMHEDWEIYDAKLNFYEAMEKMRNGFKVLNIENNVIYYIENGQFKSENENDLAFANDFNSTIWELID